MVTQSELEFVKSRLSFFPHLSGTEKELFESSVASASFKKGSLLKNGRTSCPGVILIKTGSIRVYMLSEDGREVTLYRLYSGDVCTLSASCVITPLSFDVQIMAETDVALYLVPAHAFAKLSKMNIYVENFAYKTTILRFSDVMHAVEQLLFTKFDIRLARFLLDEEKRTGSADGLHITHEQLAQYLGSAREVVSRALKRFQEAGCISQSRGTIQITGRKQLEQTAGTDSE